jgi:uncharacterized membrane protein (DUF485 family)
MSGDLHTGEPHTRDLDTREWDPPARSRSRRELRRSPPGPSQPEVRRLRPMRRALDDAPRPVRRLLQPSTTLAELEAGNRRLVWSLVVGYGLYYLLFVVAGYMPGLMRVRVAGPFSLGSLFAFSQFPAAAVVVWAYSRLAARRVDPLARRLREEIGRSDG